MAVFKLKLQKTHYNTKIIHNQAEYFFVEFTISFRDFKLQIFYSLDKILHLFILHCYWDIVR
jgi:hypothetical protein